MENVNRTGNFFSPPRECGDFAGSLAGDFPFSVGTEVAGSRQDAPPILSPGERMRRARWKRGARGTLSMGFPWTPPRRHKEGGPACPPSLETPSLGDGSREPPSHGQKAVPAPLLRKGGIPRNHLAFSGKVPSYPQQPRCGSEKRTAGHPEMLPAFSCSYAVEWSKPPATTGPNPRNRRRERSGRSPECRRPSFFLLTPSKSAFSFRRNR